jgi:hypothetical protein
MRAHLDSPEIKEAEYRKIPGSYKNSIISGEITLRMYVCPRIRPGYQERVSPFLVFVIYIFMFN